MTMLERLRMLLYVIIELVFLRRSPVEQLVLLYRRVRVHRPRDVVPILKEIH
jgi:hypothetical protein